MAEATNPKPEIPEASAPAEPGGKIPRMTPALLLLVAMNLIPLAGVLFFGWEAAMVVLLYWAENLVVGASTILKIAAVRTAGGLEHLFKLIAIPFFCIHYGGFCAVHGIFLVAIFKVGGDGGNVFPHGAWVGPLVFIQLLVGVVRHVWINHPPGMGWAVLGLAASHGFSFVQNFIGRGEYTRLESKDLMFLPYRRIVIMHIAIMAGAIPVMLLGSPVPLLCVLIILKIAVDVKLHARAHADGQTGQEAAT